MARTVMEYLSVNSDKSFASSEALFESFVIAPLAELPIDVLTSEVTKRDCGWLCVDRFGSNGEYDEHGMDIADHRGIYVPASHQDDGVDPDVYIVRTVSPTEESHDENCRMFWSSVWKEEYGGCYCSCEVRVKQRARREQIVSKVVPTVATLGTVIEKPLGAEFVVQHVMGARLDGYTLPVEWFSDSGLTPEEAFNPVVSNGNVFIAPVYSGYSRQGPRWFGAAFKSIGAKTRKKEHEVLPLGSVITKLHSTVKSLVGEEVLSALSIRPLGRTRFAPGRRAVIADVWPITDYVSLAVAIPNSGEVNDKVRRLTHWSSGTLGACSLGTIKLCNTLFAMLTDTRSAGNGTRHADFLWRGMPEPLIRINGPILDRIMNLTVRKTFEESPTLIVLEGLHS